MKLLLDGRHHGLREDGLVAAQLGIHDARLVAAVNVTLRVRPLADTFNALKTT